MKVCEIYASIQGESTFAGLPCTFIRLSGCNLKCTYCDTVYALEEGGEMPVAEILEKVALVNIGLVEITGGEPLLQRSETIGLTELLLNAGHTVLIETNGSLHIGGIDERAVIILDVKTPGSGMSDNNDLSNFALLKRTDEVKFVICGIDDYAWSRSLVHAHRLHEKCTVLFSPAYGKLQARELASWIMRDRLPVRLNIQIHKYIFGPDERRV